MDNDALIVAGKFYNSMRISSGPMEVVVTCPRARLTQMSLALPTRSVLQSRNSIPLGHPS